MSSKISPPRAHFELSKNIDTVIKKRTGFVMFVIYVIILIVVFGFIYKKLQEDGTDFMHFDKPKNFDPFYFSVINMTTVGFGEYTPISTIGRGIVCFQILLFWSSVLYYSISTVE